MTSRLTISPLTTMSSTWATCASTRLRSSSISVTTAVSLANDDEDVTDVQQVTSVRASAAWTERSLE